MFIPCSFPPLPSLTHPTPSFASSSSSCHHSRLAAILPKLQMRAASQTCGAFRRRTEYCTIPSALTPFSTPSHSSKGRSRDRTYCSNRYCKQIRHPPPSGGRNTPRENPHPLPLGVPGISGCSDRVGNRA